MMIAGASLASTALGSATAQSNKLVDPWDAFPLTVIINNLLVYPKIGSLSIDETQGETASMSVVLVDPFQVPSLGEPVSVRYFDQVLFAGTLEKVERSVTQTGGTALFKCTAVDWSQVLTRRRVKRRFTNVTLPNLVNSLLENEAAGDGFALGTIDQQGSMELVDAENMSVLDVMREAASVGGQVLTVDYDKQLLFRNSSQPIAPIQLTNATAETVSVEESREAYRNVQTVTCKGTAPEGVTALELTVTVENAGQIAERQSIEGGSGRYENMDSVTHPLSNTPLFLARLATAYANQLLAVYSTTKQTIKARVRGYGLRGGQIMTVTLPEHSANGDWQIQRIQIRDEDGLRLVNELELVHSSLQRRTASIWASILKKGKLIVSLPGSALSTTTASFTTAGTFQWVAPIAGDINITAMGGSGGGGGAAKITSDNGSVRYARGGRGGASGKTTTTVSVLVGDVLDIVVGAKGTGGASSQVISNAQTASSPGTNGTASTVSRTGTLLCQGDGGGRGRETLVFAYFLGCKAGAVGADGIPGAGSNGVVSVGGGKAGGAPGTASCTTNATSGAAGLDGSVTIEY